MTASCEHVQKTGGPSPLRSGSLSVSGHRYPELTRGDANKTMPLVPEGKRRWGEAENARRGESGAARATENRLTAAKKEEQALKREGVWIYDEKTKGRKHG